MHDYLWVFPALLVTGAACYAIYALVSRGWKGAMFGYKIAETDPSRIEYRHHGARHTIRIHKLGDDDLYGLEIGRWSVIFGETSPIVIPRQQLLQLRDMITEFVVATT